MRAKQQIANRDVTCQTIYKIIETTLFVAQGEDNKRGIENISKSTAY